MTRTTTALGLLTLLALTACGGEDRGSAGGSAARDSGSGNDGGVVSAADVAEEARGKVRCPAKVATPERAAGAPVDDVLGVRPGLSYDEAANLVLCSNELIVITEDESRGFQIQSYGQKLRQGFAARSAKPRDETPKSSQDYLSEMSEAAANRSGNAVVPDMAPGEVKWYVGTLGLPGADRVIDVAREEWFEAGRNPTLESVRQALVAKHGRPSRAGDGGTQRQLQWSFDPSGQQLEDNAIGECIGGSSPDGGFSVTPDCGLVVEARIFALQDNPVLAEYFQVGVVDQAGAYRRLEALKAALEQAEQSRRAQQVHDAAKNAAVPQL